LKLYGIDDFVSATRDRKTVLFDASYGIVERWIGGATICVVYALSELRETCERYSGRRIGLSPMTMVPIIRTASIVFQVGNVAQLNQKRFAGSRQRTEAIAYKANSADVPNGTELPLSPKNRYWKACTGVMLG
jgi:hypothetical protein